MTEQESLPVVGDEAQSSANIALVNKNKHTEEIILRVLDAMADNPSFDQRWLAIGRTHIEIGFMAINRAVLRPERIQLPADKVQL